MYRCYQKENMYNYTRLILNRYSLDDLGILCSNLMLSNNIVHHVHS
uniref:Uncharacterized protein n=1 Tax=Anguilla anguilla TaxID=7936 RepID=A0A0E9WEY2_ANGAN